MRPKGAENQDLFRSLYINSEIGTSYVGNQGGVSGAKIHFSARLLRFRRLQSHNWPKLRKWDIKLWNLRHKRFPKVRVFRTFGAHSELLAFATEGKRLKYMGIQDSEQEHERK
jgi:hypothetical protein